MESKTQIKSLGNFLNVEIPPAIAESLKLKANDILICHVEEGKLILETVKNSDYSLDELLAEEIEISQEIDWGSPQGEEI
ncbi:MAG: AbrB/MazE/SpoVT family DNA-binding domain-containing protein [Gomphosphaeria aponina SAG 52.96 = DSM 107014]|uniref:AbrB/MazE/SpoVT family DNA-binding domain-containing protein n=1 Tax=Gomphosphaeria aponina SAG 52.96 = DSM 107014 TaxID=1521640 RepID=A0A941GMZ8_9CHRO|nr:AbrB/MazE/SpoVT family DNA-binding domain-containing protein [Gomphosphaeria aponina SAG 52.96 = DSM 107014]